MFEIKVKKSFDAAHALSRDGRKFEEPHSHTWGCEICIRASKLDDSGCAVDFIDADRMIDAVLEEISGRNVAELPFFRNISPSTENIAKYIFDELSEAFDDTDARLFRVTIWEDEHHSASYFVEA